MKKSRVRQLPIDDLAVPVEPALYLEGDGTSGPLGVKRVVSWLNERGYRTRLGARFGVATIHGILTNAIYIGDSVFNKRDSRTLKQKPVKEHVATEVPAIISKADFEAVAASLKVGNPRTTAPRVVTGPILLTGVAVCGGCDGAMTLRTGTSSTGKIHKYYTCSTCARQGKTACKGRSIPMDKLDTLVPKISSSDCFSRSVSTSSSGNWPTAAPTRRPRSTGESQTCRRSLRPRKTS